MVKEKAKEGFDTIETGLSWTLGRNIEGLLLTGSAEINGTGNKLDNLLTGNVGANELVGNNGNDTLSGGGGMDRLTGGKGNDIFVFATLAEMGTQKGETVVITDFKRSKDQIDLSGLDANIATEENNSFTVMLKGKEKFTEAGQLKFADGVLYGNVDADADADFAIELIGLNGLIMDNINIIEG